MAKIQKRLRNISLPRFIKYKKPFKKLVLATRTFYRNTALKFGLCGLKLMKQVILTPQQVETSRKTFIRFIVKHKEQFWLRFKPQIAGTEKPENMRMGKGKGAVTH